MREIIFWLVIIAVTLVSTVLCIWNYHIWTRDAYEWDDEAEQAKVDAIMGLPPLSDDDWNVQR